ncbi:MAG: hypothetical protein Q8Q14_01435 [Gemmatimonadales bacterium]|nr:hypothetical protein [Gemmatimonadales bacterium]
MKEPGDIYLDELVRELQRRLHGQRQVPVADALRVAQEAEKTAAEATIYHLVQQLGFLENEVLEIIADFRDTKRRRREGEPRAAPSSVDRRRAAAPAAERKLRGGAAPAPRVRAR